MRINYSSGIYEIHKSMTKNFSPFHSECLDCFVFLFIFKTLISKFYF